MRLLLIACDFPPVPSPQAIRWAYLCRELALAGHEVHVLSPQVIGLGDGLPELPVGVTVHRVYPGRINSLANRLQERRRIDLIGGRARPPGKEVTSQSTVSELNWKGRLRQSGEDAINQWLWHGTDWRANIAELLRRARGWCLFPDARSEWLPHARAHLARLLDELRPDAVITSHEPANTIELGAFAKQRGATWIADLGDPVLAPYTPRRWRRHALALERTLCERADIVTVTSEHARDLLIARHGRAPSSMLVVTQGFDQYFNPVGIATVMLDVAKLELLYTGSLYAFRRIDALIGALVLVPGVRLNIASAMVPPDIIALARRSGASVRLLGFVPHRYALALQRRCDVLVNIANDDPVQVPGKLYEYLGAGAPILQIGGVDVDAGAQLVRDAGLGWCERADADALAARLRTLLAEKARTGRVARPGATDYDTGQHAWHRLASTLVRAIATEQPQTRKAVPPSNRASR